MRAANAPIGKKDRLVMVSASGWEKIEKYTDQTLNWIKYEKGTRKLASDFDSDSKLVHGKGMSK